MFAIHYSYMIEKIIITEGSSTKDGCHDPCDDYKYLSHILITWLMRKLQITEYIRVTIIMVNRDKLIDIQTNEKFETFAIVMINEEAYQMQHFLGHVRHITTNQTET